jgi:NAD+ synthase (glutamine-hydrolysing)
MKIALIQFNATVGAMKDNASRIIMQASEAHAQGHDLIVFPELSLCGYPPDDLILSPAFIAANGEQIERLAKELPAGALVVIGAPLCEKNNIFNAAIAFHKGRQLAVARKMSLPNYGVFDEKRLFTPGEKPAVFSWQGLTLGIHICEDSWQASGPAFAGLEKAGLDLLINISASPYHQGKIREREAILGPAAARVRAPVLYTNLVGGQDELVFDGGSMAITPDGAILGRAKMFAEDRLSLAYENGLCAARLEPYPDTVGEVYEALKLAIHDYVEKNRFNGALVALSGGIDSALVAAITVDAIGANRVHGVTLPSLYSSSATHGDALELAQRLGMDCLDLSIHDILESYLKTFKAAWSAPNAGVTEENLQARIRGTLVMALSNQQGWLVISTGNKSEIATGYCTLYGDMCGGFALIKDVPKTLVFELARWRNARGATPVIPPSTISRPPSAELRPDQKDTDSLPPYDVLDPILELYVEQNQPAGTIIAAGYDGNMVRRIIRLVDRNEYKRRQAAPGVKITPKAFGRDRRIPITNHFDASVQSTSEHKGT